MKTLWIVPLLPREEYDGHSQSNHEWDTNTSSDGDFLGLYLSGIAGGIAIVGRRTRTTQDGLTGSGLLFGWGN